MNANHGLRLPVPQAPVRAEVHMSDRAQPPTAEELTVLGLALADLLGADVASGAEAPTWRLSGRWWAHGPAAAYPAL